MLNKIVQHEEIESMWEEVGMMNEDEAMGLIDEIGDAQPALLEYLMTAPEEFNDAEAEQMLYIGVILWKIMNKHSQEMKVISEEELLNLEDKNIAMMEQLQGESEGDGIALIENFLNDYPQPNILASISSALIIDDMEEDDEDEEISEDARGTMMLVLKTALDAMHNNAH